MSVRPLVLGIEPDALTLAGVDAARLAVSALTDGVAHDAVTLRDGRLYGTVIDILDRAAPLAIIALGMTLVIATGGIDLSVGAVLAISGAVAAALMRDGWSMPTATIGTRMFV